MCVFSICIHKFFAERWRESGDQGVGSPKTKNFYLTNTVWLWELQTKIVSLTLLFFVQLLENKYEKNLLEFRTSQLQL